MSFRGRARARWTYTPAAGAGTLDVYPGSASGTVPVTLTWSVGEMRDGVALSLRVTGVRDALGNRIGTTSNSATALGIGVGPVFSGLTATPAVAGVGEMVILEFAASEPLSGDPEVTVNGNLTTRTAKVNFTYSYTVDSVDRNGPAVVDITGFDLAGNIGTLRVSNALTLDIPEPEVPLWAWPMALALLVVGVRTLALRRKVIALLVLALLAAPVAMAVPPTVSNVVFVQQPSATGTEVLITYDLTAPNGPCTIVVKLSKNGGADGYVFPVSSVTGDVSGVTTGTGKQIVWDIATDYANKSYPNARLRLTANDGVSPWHSIDTTDPRGEISLSELLRVIQFYNSGGFHCEEGTEDGYGPEPGDQSCASSDLDYNTQDWIISLSELLRAIQFYNTRGYSTSCDSEDGFQPGVGPIFDCGEGEGEGEGQLVEMIAVAAGSFDMGRTASGDDETFGDPDELPLHTVTLSAYQIGKYEVTNRQYCDVLNYAIAPARNYLRTSANAVWSGTGDIYASGIGKILAITNPDCHIQFSAGSFSPKSRAGLPAGNNYSMTSFPVQLVTWYGAAMFCNWLSEMEGLTPVYGPSPDGWGANFGNTGYHLPTEAQWERAAAWDGAKHWIYGFTADTLTGKERANYFDSTPDYVNPFGLTTFPYTSATGWFNGVSVSPNGGVTTANSMSPVGCYDMSGNVSEWCHDWYSETYYSRSLGTDPQGDENGDYAVARSGSWVDLPIYCRSANRKFFGRADARSGVGFRIASYGGIVQHTLDYTTNGYGTILGSTRQKVTSGTSGTAVKAVSYADHGFLKWSDGVLTATRTDTNVLADLDVMAIFSNFPGEMISVAGGSFSMGRTSSDDDELFGALDEVPLHTVTLSAYQIGKYEVTNQEYCKVLNYAIDPSRNYLRTDGNAVWTGTGDIYAGESHSKILGFSDTECNIRFNAGTFYPKFRVGLLETDLYSTDLHPVQSVSWHGAVMYCNWLSEMEGLTPVYDPSTVAWSANFSNNGYHLPTEAQWERAAAWDGTKHWVYGFTSDILTGKDRANYFDSAPGYVNPFGLTTEPFTSDVGWFYSDHNSPNGFITTLYSLSPVGCYDMSGNVSEWCHDWYDGAYYSTSPGADPPGAESGSARVVRGGSWGTVKNFCRSAARSSDAPEVTSSEYGFRIAR